MAKLKHHKISPPKASRRRTDAPLASDPPGAENPATLPLSPAGVNAAVVGKAVLRPMDPVQASTKPTAYARKIAKTNTFGTNMQKHLAKELSRQSLMGLLHRMTSL